ncbi:MAG: hypothetical protein KME40_32755 [Komarekiella atlantica HA4396-MV6]|nr:hypothetical protein [Komarekiella atlantica HA4396-MV6]
MATLRASHRASEGFPPSKLRLGFPNLGTPLATSRETRPTQWLNFSRQINIGVHQCTLQEALRVQQSPAEGNPPAALPHRCASTSVVRFNKSRLMQEV